MGKVYQLSEAISKYVKDGDSIAFGGFTTNRKPIAATSEILRQGQKDFVLYTGAGGSEADMLIGAGRVKAFINCYTANSGVTNVCRRFRKAIEKNEILFEDYSQDALLLMLHGAMLGLPYIPIRMMLGTGLIDEWGISEEVRKTVDKLPNKKYVLQDNPFDPGHQIVQLPVPQLDVAVIHVQKASVSGTCIIEGDEFHDVDIAIAAKSTIVTCEELVSDEVIRRDPTVTNIPGFCVQAVVQVPYGAHPSQCYNYYDYDNVFYKHYDQVSKTEEEFDQFIQEWVMGVKDNDEYIDKIGASRLAKLKPVQGLGYAVDMTKMAQEGK